MVICRIKIHPHFYPPGIECRYLAFQGFCAKSAGTCRIVDCLVLRSHHTLVEISSQDRDHTIVIDPRFCGPPASGNGGYVCGRLADHIDGWATVRLVSPPPLNTLMALKRTDDGVELLNGQDLVGKAWTQSFELAVPACPALADAHKMSERYAGFGQHAFSTCFVCGPDRAKGDGLRIFPGLSHDATLVGCPWLPAPSLCDEEGHLLPRYVWSALDCPSGWAFLHDSDRPAVLGEFSVCIDSTVTSGQELIVIGWEIESSGRKHLTGSALYTAEGDLMAHGLATWFEIEPGQFQSRVQCSVNPVP